MDFLKHQLFILYLSGLICPKLWVQNWCKKILYNMFTLAIVIVFPLILSVLMVTLMQQLDDLSTVIAIIYNMLCFISVYINFIYVLRNKSNLLNLIERIETEFIFYMERVGSPQRRETIILKRSKIAKNITYLMLSMYLFVMFFWTIFPWFLGYKDYFMNTDEQINTDMQNYFGMPILLPENINKFPIYEIVQIFHFVSAYSIVTNITACYMVIFILTYHAATLFKLIYAAFEYFDHFERNLRREYELEDDVISDCDSLKSDGSKTYDFHQSKTEERSANYGGNTNQDTANKSISINENELEFSINNSNTSTIQDPKNNEEYQRRLYKYLVDCVEFHQAAIRYTDDLNDLVSPMIFIFFIFTELMLCLSAFQLVLAKMDERKLKFLTSSSTLFAWPLILCHYGDDLKSSAVKESVFSIRWYTQSKSINKLLQMVMIRAQQPVTIRPGKFYVATLETFSDICHKVYAYLTLLRQMYDN
ncbi:Odorant receptor 7a [Blattella germanica]|nr:Odorant receptor 7a [Blattella germanica]